MMDSSGYLMMDWAEFISLVVVLCVVDRSCMGRFSSFIGHVLILVFWLLSAVAYAVYITLRRGPDAGSLWLLGYIVELVLSCDNVFGFIIVLSFFKVPRKFHHKALTCAVLCALVMRFFVFVFLVHLSTSAQWVVLLCGLFLIYSGVQAFIQLSDHDDGSNVSNSMSVRIVSSFLGGCIVHTYDNEGSFFVKDTEDRFAATLMVPVVVSLIFIDICFAMDSLSAKLGAIPDAFISFSSSALAMLTLRALFFVLSDAVDAFKYLPPGVCLVAIIVGAELIIAEFVVLPSLLSLYFIGAVFGLSVVGSVLADFAEGVSFGGQLSQDLERTIAEPAETTALVNELKDEATMRPTVEKAAPRVSGKIDKLRTVFDRPMSYPPLPNI
eukprot:TRINITY_DN50313_c0_g1_i1.p1 TRINITY_DN50313_c0_g1~~TRINITY_DN50313_c0_g1_i1.p1  ORF type:complete len:449 (+),score=49.90 TRINITY_DN50313_c0_g1_i1:204-1349(+)